MVYHNYIISWSCSVVYHNYIISWSCSVVYHNYIISRSCSVVYLQSNYRNYCLNKTWHSLITTGALTLNPVLDNFYANNNSV